jgi:transcriptional regulator with XRE-family HTH domain
LTINSVRVYDALVMALETERRFAARLKRVRELRGWTQDQLADAMGVSKAAVRLYEAEKSEPRWVAVSRLIDRLGIAYWVFTRDEIDWRDVERVILEKRIRDTYERPYEPDIRPGKDNVNDNVPQRVAVLAL